MNGHEQRKRRLKGLDEMPTRRTMRQRYFSIRSRLRTSTFLRWVWLFAKFALLLLALWGIAHLIGLRVEL